MTASCMPFVSCRDTAHTEAHKAAFVVYENEPLCKTWACVAPERMAGEVFFRPNRVAKVSERIRKERQDSGEAQIKVGGG